MFDADSGAYVPDRGRVGDARSPMFHQLDLRAQYTFTGQLALFSVYLDVQNVLNVANEEFRLYDYRFRDSGSLSGIPILPTFGLKARF